MPVSVARHAGFCMGVKRAVDLSLIHISGLKAFVAAVFGGIGSVPGAVVGAFIIGICENIIKGLDVILIKAGLSKQMLGLTTFSDASVSYTHLDVYKRQATITAERSLR